MTTAEQSKIAYIHKGRPAEAVLPVVEKGDAAFLEAIIEPTLRLQANEDGSTHKMTRWKLFPGDPLSTATITFGSNEHRHDGVESTDYYVSLGGYQDGVYEDWGSMSTSSDGLVVSEWRGLRTMTRESRPPGVDPELWEAQKDNVTSIIQSQHFFEQINNEMFNIDGSVSHASLDAFFDQCALWLGGQWPGDEQHKAATPADRFGNMIDRMQPHTITRKTELPGKDVKHSIVSVTDGRNHPRQVTVTQERRVNRIPNVTGVTTATEVQRWMYGLKGAWHYLVHDMPHPQGVSLHGARAIEQNRAHVIRSEEQQGRLPTAEPTVAQAGIDLITGLALASSPKPVRRPSNVLYLARR